METSDDGARPQVDDRTMEQIHRRFGGLQQQINTRFSGMHEALEKNRDDVRAQKERLSSIEEKLDALLAIFNATKKGASYFARFARFIRNAAVFMTPILTLLGVVWAIAHGRLPHGE